MSPFHGWRKRIPEALFGELDMKTRKKLDRHLAACPACSGLLQEMKGTLETMAGDPTPDPGPEFWDGYWDALVLRLGSETMDARPVASSSRPRTDGVRTWARWALGAAAAASFLIIGFFIGRNLDRLSPRGPLPASTAGPAAAPASAETPLLSRTSRYLQRSKMLLLAVVNFDQAASDFYGLNPPLQKRTSAELMREGAVLKKELRGEDPRLERLLSELEMIFLQIANLKAEGDLSEVELIRTGLEQNDILFRINLSELRRSSGKRKIQSRFQGGRGESALPAASV
jgi:hypothetical protein